MLDGFGLYPVSLQVDIDSYDGDWRHVARFRNRTGWLAVAEAEVWSGHDLCATLPIVAGCDENEEEIPSFIAANLLACASSYPEPCLEVVPEVLDELLETARADVRKRWLRENIATIAAIHEEAEEALHDLESKVAVQSRKSEKAIAQLRRQRRFLQDEDPQRAALAEAIAREEAWQDHLVEWLTEQRERLRAHYDALERKASKGLRPRIVIDLLYVVNWRHTPNVDSFTSEVHAQLLSDTCLFPASDRFLLNLEHVRDRALATALQKGAFRSSSGRWTDAKEVKNPALGSPLPEGARKAQQIVIDWAAFDKSLAAHTAEQAEAVPSSTPSARPALTLPSPSKAAPAPAPRAAPVPIRAAVAKRSGGTRLERTEAKRHDVAARLAAVRKERGGFPPGSKRFLAAQRQERRLTNFVAALDAEIASLRSRSQVPEAPAMVAPKPPPAPSPAPITRPPSVPSPLAHRHLQVERAALLKQLRELEIKAQKFRPGSRKTHRNQLARIEISRKIAALDECITALSAAEPTAKPGKTKQDLADELLHQLDGRQRDTQEPA
jgi:hypothetical protein